MRILFVLIVLANVWAYALGQGWLGRPPGDEGRRSVPLNELNAGKVTLTAK